MCSEVVPKQQRVPVIEAPGNSDVTVDSDGPAGLRIELREFVLGAGGARRGVIAVDVCPPDESDRLRCRPDRSLQQVIDRHLDVDHILGGETGNAGRPDVVDVESDGPEAVTNLARNRDEFVAPLGPIESDLDLVRHVWPGGGPLPKLVSTA